MWVVHGRPSRASAVHLRCTGMACSAVASPLGTLVRLSDTPAAPALVVRRARVKSPLSYVKPLVGARPVAASTAVRRASASRAR